MRVSFKGWLPASYYPISVFLINVHLSIHKTDRIRFPEFPNPCFQGVWRQPVVGVQKADEFPPGVRQSFISRAAYTCVLLVEYSDPFILPRPFFNNLRRFVSAAKLGRASCREGVWCAGMARALQHRALTG